MQVGFDPEDIVFDPNILTVGTGLPEHNNYAVDFFKACRELKHVCPGMHRHIQYRYSVLCLFGMGSGTQSCTVQSM